MRSGHRILVVGDDQAELERLAGFLSREGFEVDVAQDRSALRARLGEAPSIAIVSRLARLGASDVLRSIRFDARLLRLPVIVLGGEGDEVDRVVAFELGADDYVAKPPSYRELSLRVRAILRRANRGQSSAGLSQTRLGPLMVDPENHEACVEGSRVALSPLELRLLAHLIDSPGEVHSRERLIEDVWGRPRDRVTRVVDTAMKRLRRKLGVGGAWLETVRGVGYRAREPRGGGATAEPRGGGATAEKGVASAAE